MKDDKTTKEELKEDTKDTGERTCSITDLTFLVLLGLKLFGKISWPFIWVFAPLWIPAVVNIITFLLVLVVMLKVDSSN